MYTRRTVSEIADITVNRFIIFRNALGPFLQRRCTAPCVVDKKARKIVSNESRWDCGGLVTKSQDPSIEVGLPQCQSLAGSKCVGDVCVFHHRVTWRAPPTVQVRYFMNRNISCVTALPKCSINEGWNESSLVRITKSAIFSPWLPDRGRLVDRGLMKVSMPLLRYST